jgi:hypothetical protein
VDIDVAEGCCFLRRQVNDVILVLVP